METFNERIKKTLEGSLSSKELNSEIIDYLVDRIIDEVVEHEQLNNKDFTKESKKLANSLIEKATELNI